MYRDDFRLYNHFKPIVVDDARYILFFNENEKVIENMLMKFPTYIRGSWGMDAADFNQFIKLNRIHFIKK